MAGGFRVTPEELRTAASAARLAGERAGEVDLGSAAETIAGALPGSTAATTSRNLAQVWHMAVTSWGTEVSAHGEKLDACALRYQATDAQAGTRLTGTGQGLAS